MPCSEDENGFSCTGLPDCKFSVSVGERYEEDAWVMNLVGELKKAVINVQEECKREERKNEMLRSGKEAEKAEEERLWLDGRLKMEFRGDTGKMVVEGPYDVLDEFYDFAKGRVKQGKVARSKHAVTITKGSAHANVFMDDVNTTIREFQQEKGSLYSTTKESLIKAKKMEEEERRRVEETRRKNQEYRQGKRRRRANSPTPSEMEG